MFALQKKSVVKVHRVSKLVSPSVRAFVGACRALHEPCTVYSCIVSGRAHLGYYVCIVNYRCPQYLLNCASSLNVVCTPDFHMRDGFDNIETWLYNFVTKLPFTL